MPKGEQRKFGKGGEEKGPAILPASSSFSSLAVTTWGCSCALFKLGDSKGRLSPINLIRKPKEKPSIKYCFKAGA